MSIKSLVTVGVAWNERKPTKSDSGEVVDESAEAGTSASLSLLLVKQVPTGLVAAYTAFTAAVVELIDVPTTSNPTPDQLLGYRWAGFAILVIGSVVMLLVSYRSCSSGRCSPACGRSGWCGGFGCRLGAGHP